MAYALKYPRLKVRAMAWLSNYPNFETKLRRLAQARGFVFAMERTSLKFTQAPPESVTPHARQIYAQLKGAIEKRQGGTD
jgi:hypothetical protein